MDRRALFEIGDIVARPRIIQIVAFQLQQGVAQGSCGHCRVRASLHGGAPAFLLDLHGTQVHATPDRFEVRALGDGAEVQVSGRRLERARGIAALRVRADRSAHRRGGAARGRRARVLERAGHARGLPRGPSRAGAGRARAGPAHRAQVDRGHPRATAAAAEASRRPSTSSRCTWATRCGSRPVESRFDAILPLRNAEGRELDCSVVSGETGQVRVPRMWAQLAPGTYYVVVDAAGADLHDGWYRLAMDFARRR
ncbi:MAG: hypothetical protein M5U28_07655 [Sandaracinaceae bacterium]|nr:hypothetical protein [Sandaracinaceae bacterium]